MAWWEKRYNALTGNQGSSDSGQVSVPSTPTPEDTQVNNSWWGDRYRQVQGLEQQRQIKLQQEIAQPTQQPEQPAPTFFDRTKSAVAKLFGRDEDIQEPTPVADTPVDRGTLSYLKDKFKIGLVNTWSTIKSGAGVYLGEIGKEVSEDRMIKSYEGLVIPSLEERVASGDNTPQLIRVPKEEGWGYDEVWKTPAEQLEDAKNKLAEMKRADAESLTDEERLKESGQKTREKAREMELEVLKNYDPPKKWSGKWLLGEVVQATPQFIGSFGVGVVTALVTKSPTTALAVGFGSSFVQESGAGFQAAKEAGLDDSHAQDVAATRGTANAIIEQIPLGEWLNKTPGGDEVKKTILQKVQANIINRVKGGIYEGSTETIQEIVGNAIESTYDEDKEFFEGAIEAGVISFPLGFIGAGGTASNEVVDTDAIQRAEDFVEEAVSTPPEERTEQQRQALEDLSTTELTVDEARNILEDSKEDSFFNQQLSNVIKLAETEDKNIGMTLAEDGTSVEFKLVDRPLFSTDYRPADTITRDETGRFTPENDPVQVKEDVRLDTTDLQLDEITEQKIQELNAEDVKSPLTEEADSQGFRRFYQAVAKDGESDWYFDNPEALARFMRYGSSENTDFRFVDIKTDEMVKDPVRPDVWRVKGATQGQPIKLTPPPAEKVTTIRKTEDIENENIKEVIRGTKPAEGNINETKRALKNVADSRSRERVDKSMIAKSPTELKNVVDSLNKFGQAYAILRKTGGLTNPKAVGQFVSEYGKVGATIAPEGEIRFRGKYIANDKDYMSVQAHELGHAIEYHITGQINKETLSVFGDDLTSAQKETIMSELKEVTLKLEGQAALDRNPIYYNRPTELLARFFELYIINNELLQDLAPTSYDLLESQSVKHPMIREFMEIIDANMRELDTPGKMFLPDLRETYQKALGSKRVGNIAYHAEIVHRALVERAKLVIPKFIDKKFENVKDSPETLFRAAESILITKDGVPEFGTRDFIFSNNPKEIQNAKDMGYKEVAEVYRNGEKVKQLAKQRYTAEEGKAFFDALSPEGQQLIKDFTSQRSEAKDYFNREVIKDVNKINSDIEGWVHHYFEAEKKTQTVGKKLRFRKQKAGARKFRSGEEGYIEDFQKAMTKALVDLEVEKSYNDFIQKQFATVSKPIPEGQNADEGWVEVVGNIQKGVGTRQEKRSVVIKDGKSFVPKQTRYQVPKAIYQRYQMHRGLIEEAGTAAKIIQRINSYWAINVLTSAGTAGTNFIGGGVQFSTKVLSDFYLETLTGNMDYKQTRRNLTAMLKVLHPKGWNNAPDWVYGGDMSNYYGQFSPKQVAKVDKAIDKFADNNLKLFGAYERYWKKVISLAEGVQDLESLNSMDKEGLQLPTDQERKALARINKEVDLYAYDYDNIPMWLTNMKRNPVATGIKPFATYPYKYAKQITQMAGAVFDRSLPWQERMAKLLSLSTVMGLYAMWSLRRKEEQETPLADSPEVEIRARAAGNVFTGLTDEEGNELFIRVSKYPFIGLTEAAIQTMQGNSQAAGNIVKEMLGSVGFVGTTALHAAGYRDEYEKYDPPEVVFGEDISSLIPYMRLLNEVSGMTDPFKRKQTTFGQAAVGSLIPVTDEDLQEKLHGEKRTIKVPIEGDVKRTPGTPYSRTTVDKVLKNYWQDILLGSLTGIYIKRVNPKDVEAQIIRDEKNRKKREEKK